MSGIMPLMIATWTQALVVLAIIVPGFVYQAGRRRVRGPDPEERGTTIRILGAVAASAVFAASYLLVLGSWLGHWLTNPNDTIERAPSELRLLALAALAMVVLVPWLAARIVYYVSTADWMLVARAWLRQNLRLRRQWDPTPTAWDYAFRNQERRWVRVQLHDGSWVGGFFAGESYASSWPEPRDLFIEKAYRLTADGTFTDVVAAPGGVWVRCEDARVVDFQPEADEDENRETTSVEGSEDGDQRQHY